MKNLFEWHHGLIRKHTPWLNKKVSHFTLPAVVYFPDSDACPRPCEILCFKVPDEQAVGSKEK